MSKLTDGERAKEVLLLRDKLIKAIEETPRGLTDKEVREAFEEACEHTQVK